MLEISLYLLIAIICGVLLVIMALLGDFDADADFDMDHDFDLGHIEPGHGDFSPGLSPLSIPILLSFGASFGCFGTLFEALEWNPLVVPIASAAVSLVVAGILYVAMLNIFVKTQASSDIKLNDMIGMDALTTIPIKNGAQGQVMVITEQRGRTLISAISEEEIPTDTTVVIKGLAGNAVIVEKKNIGGD